MKLTVASAQYPIEFHQSFEDWEKYTNSWIEKAIQQKVELLVFPEYGSMELVSLFSEEIRADIRWQVRELNSLKETFCTFFSKISKQHQIVIIAPSFPVLEDDKIYNRVFVFGKNGLAGYQDKFFMTRFENEEWGIHAAPKKLSIFEAEWGSFGIQICYDVEFPLGSQLLCSAGASLIIAPSCTETIRGATRVHVGARARALENQCFVLVSQTIGNAEWSPAVDINYGFAAAYSTPDKNLPEEGIIAVGSPQKTDWLVTELDFEKIEQVRTDGQVFNYKDLQRIENKFTNEPIEIVRIRLY